MNKIKSYNYEKTRRLKHQQCQYKFKQFRRVEAIFMKQGVISNGYQTMGNNFNMVIEIG